MTKATKKVNTLAIKESKTKEVETKVREEKQVTKNQQKEMEQMTSISARIRYLDKESFTRSQISKIIDRRYQHVRNVLETPLKRQPKKDASATATISVAK